MGNIGCSEALVSGFGSGFTSLFYQGSRFPGLRVLGFSLQGVRVSPSVGQQ